MQGPAAYCKRDERDDANGFWRLESRLNKNDLKQHNLLFPATTGLIGSEYHQTVAAHVTAI
jgi:hypothetical protein